MWQLITVLAFGLLADAALVRRNLTYSDPMDGAEMPGYIVFDNLQPRPLPTVLIAPDYLGLSPTYREFADDLARLGYVGFAMSVYSNSEAWSTPDEARAAMGRYRANLPLLRSRLLAAVAEAQKDVVVDHNRIGYTGYCFGGGAVLELARTGTTQVRGVVSFHGTLGTNTTQAPSNVSMPALILNGDMDAIVTPALREQTERELNASGQYWAFTDYGKTYHAWTKKDTARYYERSAVASWAEMQAFFDLVMPRGPPYAMSIPTDVSARLTRVNFHYNDGGADLVGYTSYDPTLGTSRRPAVLIAPDWGGIGAFSRSTADRLAALGYVGFAISVYSADEVADTIEQRRALTRRYSSNLTLLRGRMHAAVAHAQSLPNVDSSMLAVSGYCFGGGAALELARSGTLAIRAAISFHGTLTTNTTDLPSNISVPVLVMTGYNDPGIPPPVVAAMRTELRETVGRVDWAVTSYGQTVHAFTDPAVGNNPANGVAFNPKSERLSWEQMLQFLVQAGVVCSGCAPVSPPVAAPEGLGVWAIVGIAVGSAAVIAVIALIAYRIRSRRPQRADYVRVA